MTNNDIDNDVVLKTFEWCVSQEHPQKSKPDLSFYDDIVTLLTKHNVNGDILPEVMAQYVIDSIEALKKTRP